jgi:hypothetical protein
MKDPKTGRFQPTPKGQKTKKMLEVERRLGRTLEEDFREYHIDKGWGQKRIADRWGMPRGLIFHSNHRIRSQSWVAKLNLPVRRDSISSTSSNRAGFRCELCGHDAVNSHRAHWIADKDGGRTQRFNIIRLCPNHHQLLDADDPATKQRA